MKKSALMILLGASLLGGCGLIDGVNNTLSYVNEATEYANEANTFSEEVPALAERAITDPEAAQELETKLEGMKEDIQEFNDLQAPEVASDLHQKVVDQNNRALEGIEVYLSNIENGQLDPKVLENTEVFQTLNELTSLLEQIQQFGE
ncbi:hypothetical protein GLW00_16395 [Halobacillus litoralis]|uniref:Lipoprotein n=1 Tax=Halobacillus litoralis TaxID=45668 RepID=A0A845FF74_9BACI|nr:DUF6376 family protein [Halobacillus litoralis]MYL72428.1 hypothetical protein [Halobacillus litoralis]